jgi:hypothetical protein
MSVKSKLGYSKLLDKLNIKPLIPNKSYPLNKEKVDDYIKSVDVELKEALTMFFNITKHVSYKTFLFVLQNNFRELIYYLKKNNITNIKIFLGNFGYKTILEKSNFWIAQHLYQYLKSKRLVIGITIIFDFIEAKDNDFILILDDCSYSGSQLSSFFTNSIKKLNKINNVKFYILVSFISNKAINAIKHSFNDIKKSKNMLLFTKNNVIIKPLSELMPKKYTDLLDKYYYNFFETYFHDFYVGVYEKEIEFIDKYPIYFDHKLADIISTYTDIYIGFNVFNIDADRNADFLISNCSYSDEDEGVNYLLEPPCPKPPYKYSFSDSHMSSFKFKSSFSKRSFNISKNSLQLSSKNKYQLKKFSLSFNNRKNLKPLIIPKKQIKKPIATSSAKALLKPTAKALLKPIAASSAKALLKPIAASSAKVLLKPIAASSAKALLKPTATSSAKALLKPVKSKK